MRQTTETTNVSMNEVFRFHWSYARQFPRLIVVSAVSAPLAIIAERYISPLIIAALLTAIQTSTVTLESTLWMIIAYAGLQIAAQLIGFSLNLHALWGLQVHGGQKIYHDAYTKLSDHSLKFYSDNFAGSLVSKVGRLYGAFCSFWAMMIFNILFISVSIVATLIGLAFIAWQFSLAILALIILFIYVSYRSTQFMKPIQARRSKAYTDFSARLSDVVSNMLTVKIDSQERREAKRLARATDTILSREFDSRSGIVKTRSATVSIVILIRSLALVASVLAVQFGIADAGMVYLCLTYTMNLLLELTNVSDTLRSWYSIVGDSEEMIAIMHQPLDVVDTSKKRLQAVHGDIEFRNVSFQHADSDAPLFSTFNLSIPAGQRVGIVGVSGSGKTTLTKLLLRTSDIDSGRIVIDSHDITTVTQASLRARIAYVPQEPLLFHRTIRENIAYAKPAATNAEITRAAKQAGAYDFITHLSEGFDTVVGERGVKLSGGQRQRIAIARAILKDAPILVLDEATSALDSESEKLIQRSLETLMKGRTSVVVAHRLSTIAKLDRIIVMSNGAIIEDGTHDALLKKGGQYAKLWSHQSGDFIE